MKKFLVLFLAPASVIEGWMKTPEADRKAAEEKMRGEWQEWMAKNAPSLKDMPAGAGKTSRVTQGGIVDAKNDVMMYATVEAESQEAAAALFVSHPHLGIPEASIEVMQINPLPESK